MNWERVDEHIEPTGYISEVTAEKLKRTQEELCRQSKMAMARTIKTSVLMFAFGIALGAFGMVYFEQPKPQPVVTVEQGHERSSGDHPASNPTTHDIAPPNEQRVKELRFSLQKLERLKDVHDATLREAATNQGDIREMVKALEVGK